MQIKINPRFKEALPPLTPDQFKSCAMFKPNALGALNFLARMGICASAILALCTVFQVHLGITVALGCSTVAFWQLWQWLEDKKAHL